ncbi:membrane protein [Bifidobacterium bombi DSM 19703]|uniref:Membrane protein n=2 Tax=Bifidobacterium bombi TaxID=471511 RepID=A0A086BP36_9BIFI|nr:membrane protein [Bifidobacterium bombi DSM 19703]
MKKSKKTWFGLWLDKPRIAMSRRRFEGALAVGLSVGLLIFGCFAIIDFKVFVPPPVSYNSLDYDVKVLENGDMRVVEHVDVRLGQNTEHNVTEPWHHLNQSFKLDAGSLMAINDVTVTNATTKKRYTEKGMPDPNEYMDDRIWDADYAGHWYLVDTTLTDAPYDPAQVRLIDRGTDTMGLTTKTKGAAGVEPTDGALTGSGQQSWNPDYLNALNHPGYRDANGTTQSEHQRSEISRPRDNATVDLVLNIPTTMTADSMKFDIAMTFKGVCTASPDVAYLKWEPVGDGNTAPIKKVNATVKMPPGVTSKDSWAWLHYDGPSRIRQDPDGTVHFSAENIHGKRHLDFVGMFSGDYSKDMARTGVDLAKQRIMDDERGEQRQYQQVVRMRLFPFIGILLLSVLLAMADLVISVRGNVRMKFPDDLDYWRDIPDISPSAAARLFEVLSSDGAGGVPLEFKQMSATLMSLIQKKAVAIHPGKAERYKGVDLVSISPAGAEVWIRDHKTDFDDSDKSDFTLTLLPVCESHRSSLHLYESEEALLELFMDVEGRHLPVSFDLAQFNSDLKANPKANLLVRKYKMSIYNEYTALNLSKPCGRGVFALTTLAFFAAFAIVMVYNTVFEYTAPLFGAMCTSLVISLAVFAKAFSMEFKLTDAGHMQAVKVLGLVRYLNDFSDFTDLDVPDMVLWGDYLVYATAFGISDKAVLLLSKVNSIVGAAKNMNAAPLSPLYGMLSHAALVDSNSANASNPWSVATAGSSVAHAGGSLLSAMGTQLSTGFGVLWQSVSAASSPESGGASGGFFSGGSGGGFSGVGFGGSGGGSGGSAFGAS